MFMILFIVPLIKMSAPSSSWDFLCTFQTQQRKRTECCVLETPISPEPRYLILSTSPVLTTGDMSSTTTTELILRILRDILSTPGFPYVKCKCTVRNPICSDRTLIMLLMKCVNICDLWTVIWRSKVQIVHVFTQVNMRRVFEFKKKK